MTGPAAKDVDLFAGPGGWDLGARELGLEPLGIEWDEAACATRDAAGLPTLRADVAALDPLDFAPCRVLIASPPCQAFSSAGKGGGHRDAPIIYEVMHGLLDGIDLRAEERDQMEDPRSLLVAEPLRWILALRPRRVALEQVPPVLPFWEWLADALRQVGYSAATGVLSAERYGVPQTRARAFLVASLDGPAELPAPTHQRYVAMPRERPDHDRLFDPGRRERIVAPGDEALLPWVSMADALGWSARDRAGWARDNDLDDGLEKRERDLRDGDEPSLAVTSKTRSWQHELAERPAGTLCGHHTPRWAYAQGKQDNATVRDVAEPAPTLAFGNDMASARFVERERVGDRADEGFDPAEMPAQAIIPKTRSWSVRTTNFTRLSRTDPDGGSVPYERSADAPAPTLDTAADRWSVERAEEQPDWTTERPAPTLLSTHKSDLGGLVGHQLPLGEGRNVGGRDWTDGRPSTTIVGDPRVAQPGHKKDAQFPDAPRRQEGAVRITIEEASILQGFPPDHPWAGSRTKQFEQVGNAVPPPLAQAVLEALLR